MRLPVRLTRPSHAPCHWHESRPHAACAQKQEAGCQVCSMATHRLEDLSQVHMHGRPRASGHREQAAGRGARYGFISDNGVC